MSPKNCVLRKCTTCKFAVNSWEWRQCRNSDCPHEYTTLQPGENMPAPTAKKEVTLSVMDRRVYLHNHGSVCPFCFIIDTMVDGPREQVTDLKLSQPMRCKKGHEWHEIYSLTGVMTNHEHEIAYPPNEPNSQPITSHREPANSV